MHLYGALNTHVGATQSGQLRLFRAHNSVGAAAGDTCTILRQHVDVRYPLVTLRSYITDRNNGCRHEVSTKYFHSALEYTINLIKTLKNVQ